jgi:Uma2 family endonuclease
MKVTVTRPTLPMTYDEYALLPQDRNRYEVMEGELYMTPSPSPDHQDAVTELASILHNHVAAGGLGKVYVAPLDVVFTETNILQPDILFLRAGRIPPKGAKNVTLAPDLVIEVVSPSSAEQDREIKPHVYARHGVPHYWIADPAAGTLEMYALAGAAYTAAGAFSDDATATTPLFPGLTIPLARLWA